jgi:hypothetical protein
MTAPGNGPLFLALTLSILMSSAYAIGRIHQWHRHGLARDEAYRRGYDRASMSILTMMNRQKTVAVSSGATVTPITARSAGRQSRARGLAAVRPRNHVRLPEECDRTGT